MQSFQIASRLLSFQHIPVFKPIELIIFIYPYFPFATKIVYKLIKCNSPELLFQFIHNSSVDTTQ